MIRAVYCGGPWRGTYTAYAAFGATGRGIRPGVPKVDPEGLIGVDEFSVCGTFDLIVPVGADHLRVDTAWMSCTHGALAWWRPSLEVVWNHFNKAPSGPLALVFFGGWANDSTAHFYRARAFFRRELSKRPGGGTITCPALDLINTPLDALSTQVEGVLRLVRSATPGATLCVLGHSTGALIVREALRRLVAADEEAARLHGK